MSDPDENSILYSMRKMCVADPEDDSFDVDLITHINTVFFALYQLGVGPAQPFKISGLDSTWDEFIVRSDIEAVKSYMYLRLRILFDPPTTATMYDAIDKQTKELEWRLNSTVDYSQEGE